MEDGRCKMADVKCLPAGKAGKMYKTDFLTNRQ